MHLAGADAASTAAFRNPETVSLPTMQSPTAWPAATRPNVPPLPARSGPHGRLPFAGRLVVCLFAALAAGCASTGERPCRGGETVMISDTLTFGTNKPGGVVTAEEWRDFLATGVTPRFPQGITSWSASGQWRGASGVIEHEASYVLQVVHADSAEAERGVREVMDLYRKRFEQEAVLRVRQPVCTSFT